MGIRRTITPLFTAVVLCTAIVLFTTGLGAYASPSNTAKRLAKAAGYLASVQKSNGSIVAFSPIGSTADAVSAFVAAGVGTTNVTKAIGYLRRQVAAGHVDSTGLQAKVVLAVTAAGDDPRSFGGHDLVADIQATLGSNGQFGDAVVLDDALAALALESAGVQPGTDVAAWLISAQCPDGGWSYDKPYDPSTDDADCYDGSPTDFYTADSNTTSYVVQALEAVNDPAWSADPFAYFETVRDPVHEGWSYSSAFLSTDANSTALVLQAYDAAGTRTPSGGLKSLRDLQYSNCGAFAYDWNGAVKDDPNVGATIGAVPALAGKAFPVTGTTSGPAPTVPACS